MPSRSAILAFAGTLLLFASPARAQFDAVSPPSNAAPPGFTAPAGPPSFTAPAGRPDFMPPASPPSYTPPASPPSYTPPVSPAAPVFEPAHEVSAGFVGGVEAAYLRFALSDNSAVTHYTDTTVNSTILHTANSTPFDFEYTVCPRFWLGYVADSGFGFRARYENYSFSSTISAVQPAQPTSPDDDYFLPNNAFGFFGQFPRQQGDTLATTCRQRIDFLDGEITQQAGFGQWNVNFGGGLRYANFQMDQESWWTESGTQQYVHSHTGFDCIGPVLFVEAKRPFGYGLAVLANVRGAFLFGTSSSTMFADVRQTGNMESIAQSRDAHDLGIIFGEIQLGLEWSRDLPALRSHILAQALWEAQIMNTGSSNLNLSGYVLNIGFTR